MIDMAMELNPEERQRIYLEEKTRLEAQAEHHTGRSAGSIIAWIFGIIISLFLFSVIYNWNADSNPVSAPSDRTERSSPSNVSSGNPAHDVLMALPEQDRPRALGKIARCTGRKAFYMGMSKDRTSFWSVACTNGSAYEVAIDANATGSTKILECSTLKLVAKVSCF